MFEAQSALMLVLSIVLFVVKAFALVDCVMRSSSRFELSTPLSKNAWLVILVLSVLAHLVDWYPIGLLNLVGTGAALVYLAQLRGSQV